MENTIKTFKTYEDLRQTQQREMDDFPLGVAFGNDQFEKMMNNWGFDPNKDIDKIISIGSGCFIRKKDKQAFLDMMDRHSKERALFKLDDDNLIDMLRYELANHEYIISHDPEDTLEACGYTMNNLKNNDRLQRLFEKAKRLYFQDMAKYS